MAEMRQPHSAALDIAVGVDMVQVSRIGALVERYGRRFIERVYTAPEAADCGGEPASLAARWAAKEAVAKALGTGIGPVGLQDIEVLRDSTGRPCLSLYGKAEAQARKAGLTQWAISLTHDAGLALAFVIALRPRLIRSP
jgi:holo-[acyl-carrier protein] synthase